MAAEQGENVQAVARRLGVGGQDAIDALVQAAAPRAMAAVGQGEGVLTVARRFGIGTDGGVHGLWLHAAQGNIPVHLQRAAHVEGRRIDPAADNTTAEMAAAVNQMAAIQAVRRGSNIGVAANRYGIGARDAAVLEQSIADGILRTNRLHPQGVADLLRLRGITQPALISRLERHAIDIGAPALLQGGLAPAAVARQLGVHMRDHLALLRDMAADVGQAGRQAGP
jgi:hypothetical protein